MKTVDCVFYGLYKVTGTLFLQRDVSVDFFFNVILSLWATQTKFHPLPLYQGGGRYLIPWTTKLSAWTHTTKGKWENVFCEWVNRPFNTVGRNRQTWIDWTGALLILSAGVPYFFGDPWSWETFVWKQLWAAERRQVWLIFSCILYLVSLLTSLWYSPSLPIVHSLPLFLSDALTALSWCCIVESSDKSPYRLTDTLKE